MRTFFLMLILLMSPAFGQGAPADNTALSTLKMLSKSIDDKNYDEARKFLIDENISDSQLENLGQVVDKVVRYINQGNITPSKEGSKQYSINLRDSVIFLLEEDGKLYLTKGSTSNIPKLLEMSQLLSTPEKTMAYFLEQVKIGNYSEASTCFVPQKDYKLEKEDAQLFSEVIKSIQKQNIEGNYQGKNQKSLVSYPFGKYSVSLANENGDWLFTIYTRKHIKYLHSQVKQKNLSSLIPESLNDKVFLIKNWQWIGIIAILLVGIIAQFIFKFMFKKTVAKKLASNQEKPDEKKLKSVTILCVSICWYLLFPVLGIDKEVAEILTNAAGIMAMVSALFVVSRIVDFVKEVMMSKAELTDNKVDDVLIPMFHKLIKLATLVIGVVLIASNMGINVASLLAGIGLVGMALALAAKDTVENIFGSITVLLDKPFEVGDTVEVGGTVGTIEQIGLRSTRIRTLDCTQVNVPNSTLIKATVENKSRRTFRRTRTFLSLTYDTPPDKIEAFCEGVRELIRKHPYTRKDSYHVYFTEFNASSLDVLLLFYMDTSDYAIEQREKHRIFTDIIRLAGRLGVEFAFPTQTIHMAKPEDLYDAEKETNIDKINEAVLTGRELSTKIMSESLPEKSQLATEIDYINGNTYTKEGSK